jgi:hypothetical protein
LWSNVSRAFSRVFTAKLAAMPVSASSFSSSVSMNCLSSSLKSVPNRSLRSFRIADSGPTSKAGAACAWRAALFEVPQTAGLKRLVRAGALQMITYVIEGIFCQSCYGLRTFEVFSYLLTRVNQIAVLPE